MKNEHKHFIARLLVGAFLILGIGFRMTRFVVDAASWSLPGGSGWNNMTSFLDSTFWNNSPTSGDIVKALYGSGDEGSAYTTNWSGYTSYSCLSGGMTVEFTGVVPTALSSHTIYVIASGTYTITTGIAMNDCSALISSGIVILSGNVGGSGTITSTNKNNIIIEKIKINLGNHGNNGLFINGGTNATIKDFQAYNNIGTATAALLLSGFSYGDIRDSQLYSGANGLQMQNSYRINVQNVQSWNHGGYGVFIGSGSSIILSGITATGNVLEGIYLYNSSYITGTTIISNNNTGGIYFDNSLDNSFTNVTVIGNNLNGILFSGAHNNTLSGVASSGNKDQGIALIVSSNTSIHNVYDYYSGSATHSSLSLVGGTGHTISLFSGNHPIVGIIISGYTNTNIDIPNIFFDAYTQTNNYIDFLFSPYATLTGNAISAGSTFVSYTDSVIVDQENINLDMDYLTIAGTNTRIISGASWDGKLYAPTPITTGTKLCTVGETGTQGNEAFLDTIEVVSGSANLLINSGTTTINYHVLSGTSGQYLNVLTSVNGNIWSANTLQTGCTLDAALLCAFTTSGYIKLFAFGVPSVMSFTGTTLGGSLVVSGGYYNTGVSITFTGVHISGATLNGSGYISGTLITGDTIYSFILSNTGGDTTGMTFTIDTTTPIVTGNYPTSGSTVTGNSSITFTWSGIETNISGYDLYVELSGGIIYATGSTTGATSYTTYIANNSEYTFYVLATDKAGNTGLSTSIPFSVNVPLSGVIELSGAGIQLSGSTKYVSSTFPVYLGTNTTCNYSITGDITMGARTSGVLTGGTSITYFPIASGADGLKTIYVSLSTGNEYLSTTLTGYLDTTAPNTPSLTSPTSGATATGAFTLTWATVIDSGVGLSGYQYFVSTTGTFATLIKSGFTNATTTSVAIANMELGTTGTFYWYIKAIDTLNNSGTSAIQSFYYSGIIDSTPDSFSFNSITSARIDRVYGSNTVTITGLSTNVPALATVNRGVLYISGNMVGTTGYVQNGWTVKIELISSDEYDHAVTSTLTIGGLSVTFRITTETETDANNDITDYTDISTNLSSTEQLQIIAIFGALRDLYGGAKQDEFFNSLMVMIQSKINDLGSSSADVNKRDALQYLYDLAEQYRGDGGTSTDISSASRIVNGVYTAPNGKRYTITYDSAKKQFTSSNFITPKYFPTLDVLKYNVDINNPAGSQYANAKTIKARWGRITIDGARQTSPYTAPNHKVFYFFKSTEGQYSSYTFTTEKYFDSLEAVKENIYNNNR
ncbi:MAG: right-handed parallel beta-helix repeat-containing protein [Candidatus Absconditabacterales bacterium]